MKTMYFFNIENSAITTKKKKISCRPRPQLKSHVHSRITQVPQCHNREAAVSATPKQGQGQAPKIPRRRTLMSLISGALCPPRTARSPGRACPQVTAPAVWGI